jgi:hypothetical protein
MRGCHETQSSIWYAIELIARNEGRDVREGERIITKVIEGAVQRPSRRMVGLNFAEGRVGLLAD